MKYRVGDLVTYSQWKQWDGFDSRWGKDVCEWSNRNRGVVIGYVKIVEEDDEPTRWVPLENDVEQGTFDELRRLSGAAYKVQWVDENCPWVIHSSNNNYYESELELLCRGMR